MVIPIASDHGGFELKKHFLSLDGLSFSWKDLGPVDSTSVDYPDFADLLVSNLQEEKDSPFGVLICGSGQGMAMRANKYSNIRAALCWSVETAELARSHNNSNILCLGARMISTELGMKILHAFVNTPFEGGRHIKRVEKLVQPVVKPTTST